MEGIRAIAHKRAIGASNVAGGSGRIKNIKIMFIGLIEGADWDIEILSQYLLRGVGDPVGNLESGSIQVLNNVEEDRFE